MIPKQDRVRPRTAEELERKYQATFNGSAIKLRQPLDGKNGITPHIGENNNWWIGNEDLGIKAKGVSVTEIKKISSVNRVDTYEILFDDGREPTTFTITNGNDGYTPQKNVDYFDGINGDTPYIEDGYWYIDGTPTGVKAEGIDGTTFEPDSTLTLRDGVLSVNTATDNNRELPIKASDVDVIVGNIEVLLETI